MLKSIGRPLRYRHAFRWRASCLAACQPRDCASAALGGMPTTMSDQPRHRGFALARDVLGFQLKLLLDTLRDLLTSPLALGAAALDLLLLRQQPPRYFQAVLRLGRRSEDWIDLWASAYEEHAQPENVDAVLDKVEGLLRDPRAGAHKARVLRRWAERELRRRRQSLSAAAEANPPDRPAPTS